MASYGHLAVGLLAGRLHGGADSSRDERTSAGTLLFFAVLAELPDADVVGVALGVRDLGAFGHRGASHSFLTAVAIGLLGGLCARRFGWPAVRTAVAATLAVASHGILDACGEGGRGLPLLWPLTDARFMSPWRMLPDAPRGLSMLSRHGLLDLAVEFVVFFPLTAFALWPGRPALLRRKTPRLEPRVDASRALAPDHAQR
jgi:inner membrane protein